MLVWSSHALTTEGHIIRADRGLLSQAVSNLIENAIKYTPKGGKVRLELLKNSTGSVEISVCDNGLGIPREDRERVKARFVRLDKSRTHPGTDWAYLWLMLLLTFIMLTLLLAV